MKTIVPLKIYKLQTILYSPDPKTRIVKFSACDFGNFDKVEALKEVKLSKFSVAFFKNDVLESLELSDAFFAQCRQRQVTEIHLIDEDDKVHKVDIFSKQIITYPYKEYEAYYSVTFNLFV